MSSKLTGNFYTITIFLFYAIAFSYNLEGIASEELKPKINHSIYGNNSGPQPDTSGIDIHYLRLDVKANDTNTYIEGSAYYLAKVTLNGLSGIVLDFSHNLVADSVFVDDLKVNYLETADYLRISFVNDYPAGQEFSVHIFYKGVSPVGGFFTGLSNGRDGTFLIPVTWTLSEPFGAKDWFPAKQVLTDKIDSVDMNITTPANCLAGSNGKLLGISVLPDGSKCHHWKSRYPIDFYLISFTVSNYQDLAFTLIL